MSNAEKPRPRPQSSADSAPADERSAEMPVPRMQEVDVPDVQPSASTWKSAKHKSYGSGKSFDATKYRLQRTLSKWTGWPLIVLGLVTVLDSGSKWPIPITGFKSVVLGGVIAGIGYQLLRWLRKLPIREALLVGRQNDNTITPTMLVQELGIDPDMARHTVTAIQFEGLGDSELGKRVAEQIAREAGIEDGSILPGMEDRTVLRD